MTSESRDGRSQAAEAPPTEVVPVVENRVEIEKIDADRGGWRVVKRVATTTGTVDEALRDFRVELERRKIGTPPAGPDMPVARYECVTLVIPVVNEVPVTERRLVPVEEVCITGSSRRIVDRDA